MKVTNRQMLDIYHILVNKYNGTEDVQVKWDIMEMSNEIFVLHTRFESYKNEIVDKYGAEDGKGNKTLSVQDPNIQDLFKCESEISPLPLSIVGRIGLTFDEMMVLKPYIDSTK